MSTILLEAIQSAPKPTPSRGNGPDAGVGSAGDALGASHAGHRTFGEAVEARLKETAPSAAESAPSGASTALPEPDLQEEPVGAQEEPDAGLAQAGAEEATQSDPAGSTDVAPSNEVAGAVADRPGAAGEAQGPRSIEAASRPDGEARPDQTSNARLGAVQPEGGKAQPHSDKAHTLSSPGRSPVASSQDIPRHAASSSEVGALIQTGPRAKAENADTSAPPNGDGRPPGTAGGAPASPTSSASPPELKGHPDPRLQGPAERPLAQPTANQDPTTAVTPRESGSHKQAEEPAIVKHTAPSTAPASGSLADSAQDSEQGEQSPASLEQRRTAPERPQDSAPVKDGKSFADAIRADPASGESRAPTREGGGGSARESTQPRAEDGGSPVARESGATHARAPIAGTPPTPAGTASSALTGGQAGAHSRGSAAENAAFQASVARGLAAAVRQNGGAVTVRLSPPLLGALRIDMQISRGAVTAQFEVGGEEARQLLTQHMTSLRSMLEAKGLSVERLHVNMSPAPSAGNGPNDGAPQDAGGNGQTQGRSPQQDAADGRSRGWSDRREDPGGGARGPDGAGPGPEGAAGDHLEDVFSTRLRRSLNAVA